MDNLEKNLKEAYDKVKKQKADLVNQKDKVVEDVKKEIGTTAVKAINDDPSIGVNITTSVEEKEKATESEEDKKPLK